MSSVVTAVVTALLVLALVTLGGSDTQAEARGRVEETTAVPAPTPAPVRPTTPAAPVVTAPPAPAREISARQWQVIARDPSASFGQSIVVHGHITQFDSGTGLTSFRANVDGVRHTKWYEYETNTLLSGGQSALADLVQGDLFRAEVVVGQPYTYGNTMGGSTTAPTLAITTITRTGSAN